MTKYGHISRTIMRIKKLGSNNPAYQNTGSKNINVKISEATALEIKKVVSSGLEWGDIVKVARQMGISYKIVYDIKRGRTWKNI
jgi:uncharacterized protein (DUF111 family)